MHKDTTLAYSLGCLCICDHYHVPVALPDYSTHPTFRLWAAPVRSLYGEIRLVSSPGNVSFPRRPCSILFSDNHLDESHSVPGIANTHVITI